ncbi:MAG: hypothetical protein A3E93_01335 [Candidatus Zambryskibacteria bacterium RIFCSPHIGHO2_12_FULL_43_12b]|nr:MAG: hypothetical protein A3E93_01335 [Candidatus Zambryskibacteria bacterium RIFCSPHIGHO2_12_FULL_43_12b]
MVNRHKYKDTVWIDLNHPTTEEVRMVMEEFTIHPSIAHELISPTEKSRVELHNKYIYIILHFPVIKHGKENKGRHEVDFIIGDKFLITARYDSIDAIDGFSKMVEVNSILDREFSDDCNGILFFGIIKEIYHSLFIELEYIEKWLAKVEEGIFAEKEKEMVVAISKVSRSLLNFKKSTALHKEVLKSLGEFGEKIFDDKFAYHVRRSLDEYLKVEDALNNNIDAVSELRETNNSLLTTKQNEIMKVLTVVTFIFSPLALIASVMQIETRIRPIIGQPNDIWLIYGFFLGLGLLMYAVFKLKRWL